MKGHIHIYDAAAVGSDPSVSAVNPTGKVNYEKLDIEIRTSTVKGYQEVRQYAGNVHVVMDELPDPFDQAAKDEFEANKILLDGVIANHDGAEPDIDQKSIDVRETRIREMGQMAIYHPSLDNLDIMNYLTSIDDSINAWIRLGKTDNIIPRISADAATIGHPQYDFLNEVINPDGDKTFEFLIGKIQGLI